MKRREFISSAATSAALLYCSPFAKAEGFMATPPSEIDLIAQEGVIPMLAGEPTRMLHFGGSIVKGPSSLLRSQQSFLGPAIEVRTGQKLKVNFHNQLAEDSIIHWHGLHLPEAQDGHPSYAIASGETYTYNLEIENRAGLYWYHPHPHGRTGYQVYHGLAGLFIVRDDEEEALNLPSGDNELFFVLQDRHFDEDNQLIYVQSGHDIMMGKVGNRLLVNGDFPNQTSVRSEAYRLRFLNGGNALPYRLQWSDGSPLHLIGTDGGLLSDREDLENILLTPGERIDVLVDFSNKNVGDEIELLSIPLVENENAKPFTVYKFIIGESVNNPFTMPERLSNFDRIDISEATNPEAPKSFQLMPKKGVGWTIDGLEYDMQGARPKETVKLGSTEVWEFDLTNAGMIHPMHIHGSQFQVIERIHGPYSKGVVFDGGWKDTVAVLPGDRVRVIKRFNDHAGKFLFHCHILEHEDHSMMRNFIVKN